MRYECTKSGLYGKIIFYQRTSKLSLVDNFLHKNASPTLARTSLRLRLCQTILILSHAHNANGCYFFSRASVDRFSTSEFEKAFMRSIEPLMKAT